MAVFKLVSMPTTFHPKWPTPWCNGYHAHLECSRS